MRNPIEKNTNPTQCNTKKHTFNFDFHILPCILSYNLDIIPKIKKSNQLYRHIMLVLLDKYDEFHI